MINDQLAISSYQLIIFNCRKQITNTNALSSLSSRGVKRLRGKTEANPEIPRFARNKLRNPKIEEIATPFGLAMTCKGNKCLCINNNLRIADCRWKIVNYEITKDSIIE